MRIEPISLRGPLKMQAISRCNARYTDAIGTMAYTLYRSPVWRKRPPLFVMLHGGGQTAADFAEITRMHEIVHQSGGIALFPEQSLGAHPLGCWNWYRAQHQVADRGEPAMLAGLTRYVIDTHGVSPSRVYVAGMSAGGAMAAILGQAYPALFAAVGVHSGLPTGIAHDLLSALLVMNGGPPVQRPAAVDAEAPRMHAVPTIVFQGDRDHTVHPSNAPALIAQALGLRHGSDEAMRLSLPPQPASGDGSEITLTRHTQRRGRPDAELWMVHGSGHAWTGGGKKGCTASASRPNASREMLRFFMSQTLKTRTSFALS